MKDERKLPLQFSSISYISNSNISKVGTFFYLELFPLNIIKPLHMYTILQLL